MAEPIRFHLDESVDPDIAAALQRWGIDVTTSQQASLLGQGDPAQFAFAARQGRVLVTHDADFLRFARANPDHAGIAYCKVRTRTLGEIIRRLVFVHDTRSPDEMKGQIEFL